MALIADHLSVPDAPAPSHGRERTILIAMCTALIAVVASVSGLNVAQQQLAVDLGASQGDVLWIINAYTVALAALLMPIGAIGDRWGRKRVLLIGLTVFGLANIGAALAGSTATMIAFRVVAGAGAAMIMPVTLSVITSTFPAEERAKAVGVWAGFAGSGGMIGMFVSAFTIDVLSWRWSFVLPVVLVAVSFVITLRAVPHSADEHTSPFDTIGSILSAVAIGGLVLGIHEGPEKGWTHSLTLAGLLIGAAALVAFVVWEHRQADPLLDISVFADRGLSNGSLTITAMFAVMFGTFLVLFPFLQAVLGWSALKSASGMLPMAAVMMPMSSVAPRIAARFGSRQTMMAGLVAFAGGLVLLATQASVEGGYGSILPGLLVLGFGGGLTMTPATTAITETLPPEKQGVASALNDTTREIGGAIGVALLGSVLSSGYRSAMETSLAGLPTEAVEAASDSIGGAYAVAQMAPADMQGTIISSAQHALVDGWVSSMWVGLVVILVPLAVLAVRGRRDESADESTTVEPEGATLS